MTTKENRPTCDRTVHQTGEEATKHALTTALSAVCLLVAFTFLRGTEQILLASVGGLLIGGLK